VISRSSTVKFLIVVFGLFAPVIFAQAKTISFETKSWEVPAKLEQSAEEFFVRNDFNLYQSTKLAVLGKTDSQEAGLLDAETMTMLQAIMSQINQSPKDASLVIKNNVATEFEPGQKGQSIDLFALRNLLASDLNLMELPVVTSSPKVALGDTNNLGINELVGVGESNFTGSPKNRIHNVTVGAHKFNGLIVQPGEEFSFNKYLGEVDGEHGFLPELVIKPAGVTPEYGGGLCQVSSTAFRAAMNAGFPITARRNHSFAVQYYAPQGTDATIYPGSADLKFMNDLPSSILVRTRIEGRKLFFEYYGTKDARTITFEGPTQYDRRTDGSLKAIWIRHVTQNNEVKTQTFKSTYLPPALFHPEPTPPAPAPAPEPTPEPLTQT
jgi:vancomycin resistance protein YoaR